MRLSIFTVLSLLLLAQSGSAQFPSRGVNLMGHWHHDDYSAVPTWGTKVWGYTPPSGREYALLGSWDGTVLIEVTDPGRPRFIAFVPGPTSAWRTIRTYRHFAYIVSEGGGGIQVVDMRQIDSGVVSLKNVVSTPGAPPATHNLEIDPTSGYLYRIHSQVATAPWVPFGLRFYDLSVPDNPVYAGFWADEDVHDAQVVTYSSGPFAGRQIAFTCTTSGFTMNSLSLVEVTDKANPVRIAELAYPNAVSSHSLWLSEDRKWCFLNDELDESLLGLPSTTYVFDVADIDNPVYVTSFTNGNTATTHDAYVKGKRLFAANMASGLRVFDISDPTAAFETAWFDTWPADDLPGFQGLLSTYPFFESGTVLGSDPRNGFFTWTLGDPRLTFSFPAGLPGLIDPSGDTLRVQISESLPGDLDATTAELSYDAGWGPSSVPLLPIGSGLFEATLPALACGALVEFFVSAQSTDGFTWTDPPAAYTRSERHSTTVATTRSILFADDFETDKGWTTSWNVPAHGFWERVDPHGTPYAPEDDHSPAGVACWVTDDAPVSAHYFEFDVSWGPYWLTSPVLDVSSAAHPFVRYARWFANDGNLIRDDLFTVEVTSNGVDWVTVESVGPLGPGTTRGWFVEQFHVADFVPLSSTFQVRFSTSDIGNGSGVEAALDDFELFDVACAAPANYCTAKSNSCATQPSISSTGQSSTSSSSGFSIRGSNARQQKLGFLLYSNQGPAGAPFLGGTLCLAPPVRRTPATLSAGGQAGICTSNFTIDVNAFAAGVAGGNPQSFLQVVGQRVAVQWWGRDTVANGSYLTDALEYVVGW